MKRMLFFLLIGLSGYSFSQSRLLDIHSDELVGICGFDMKQTPNGYLVAGTGSNIHYSEFFCWVAKVDQDFNTLWRKKFKLPGQYYQVNSRTVTLSVLANDQIIVLAKTRSEDSVYTTLASFDQNGNFLWGRNWTNLFIYTESPDMNEIVPLSDSTFHISHSVLNGSTHLKMKSEGTILSSKYTHLVQQNDTTQGVFNLLCSDGGMLQILRSNVRKTVIIKLDAQYQISWAKELESDQRYIWLINASENSDGSFWLFGSVTHYNPQSNLTSQVNNVMKLSPNGNLSGAYFYEDFANIGIGQIYPLEENKFAFTSTEGTIGTINQNTGFAEIQFLDIFQANHGFQNLHKFSNGYALTGLGLNWVESKIQLFPDISEHPCLFLDEAVHEIDQDTIPLQDIHVTDIPAAVDNYSFGNTFNPVIETTDISFVEECYLGLEENSSDPELTLYPNPAASNECVTLKLNGKHSFEKVDLSIYDLQGNEVSHFQLDGSADYHTIDTQHFQAGMYFINCKVPGDSKNFTSKLVIR